MLLLIITSDYFNDAIHHWRSQWVGHSASSLRIRRDNYITWANDGLPPSSETAEEAIELDKELSDEFGQDREIKLVLLGEGQRWDRLSIKTHFWVKVREINPLCGNHDITK